MSPRRDLDRLADMRDALTDIKLLTAGDRQAFETDRSAQQAVVTATQDVPLLDEQLAGIERAEQEPPGAIDET